MAVVIILCCIRVVLPLLYIDCVAAQPFANRIGGDDGVVVVIRRSFL